MLNNWHYSGPHGLANDPCAMALSCSSMGRVLVQGKEEETLGTK